MDSFAASASTVAALPVAEEPAVARPRPRRFAWTRVSTPALLVLASVAGSLLVYAPFAGRMSLVYAFWDGPSYLTIAREGYAVAPGNPLAPDAKRPPFYASHLPGYPILVRLLSFIGYQRALLAASLLASAAAALLFHRLARDVWKLRQPALLTLVFLFLPPRWVLYRSVPASEALYTALVLASLLLFHRSRTGSSSLAAGLAASTRFSGALMLPAYALLLVRRRARLRSFLWLLAIPAGLALYFAYFVGRFRDPLLPIDRNLELVSSLVPFWDLTRIASWPARQESEFYVLATLVCLAGTLRLRRRYPVEFSYCAFQMGFYVLLSGGDWARFYLAVTPFALVLAFHEVFESRAFRILFPIAALLSIYWATRIIPFNTCRIYDQVLAHLGLCSE